MKRHVELQRLPVSDLKTGDRIRLERNEPTSLLVKKCSSTWNGTIGETLHIDAPHGDHIQRWEVFLVSTDLVFRVAHVEACPK